MSLQGQTILITGAAGGLGSVAALALAKHGAQIILLDKNLKKLEAVYDRLLAAQTPEPILYPFDLAGASELEYQELADRVEARYGALQGLLHSAAEFSHYAPLAQTSTRDWWQSLTVNLSAVFLLSRVLLPVMQKSAHASIVMTSDSHARTAPAYAGAYGVAKIALEGLAKILAEEWQSGQTVRVNTFIPGPVASPLRQRGFPAEDQSRLPGMDSLAAVYLYLFGPASIGVTGQVIDARTFRV